ncbi:uncharacterized protein LOC133883556 [Phragmites australis]|uniref:uncharacterized protein LOC133883556 n=1 Tax=Phragmites australis TaxID=29695 RepID=UPI002D77F294|nr:uncharacterized protein LOC133883556 [Phragmites australis]
MAAGCGPDKGNAPPAPSATAAGVFVARRHGFAVKKCGFMKRPSRAWGRVPLRDITNLIAASSAAAEAPLGRESSPPPAELEKPVAVLPRAAASVTMQDGVASGAAGKAGRYSLRKEFR